MVQLLGAISGEQYGGISIHEIDRLLEPYAQLTHDKNLAMFAKVTDATTAEQAARAKTSKTSTTPCRPSNARSTLTTSAAQTPFTSSLVRPNHQLASREIQQAILQVRAQGMSGETAIFPKLLFFVDDGINARTRRLTTTSNNWPWNARSTSTPTSSRHHASARNKDLLVTPMELPLSAHTHGATRRVPLTGRNNLKRGLTAQPATHRSKPKATWTFFAMLDDAMDLAVAALKIRERRHP